MSLIWDGSFLGSYPREFIRSKNKSFRKDIARIQWEEEELIVSLFRQSGKSGSLGIAIDPLTLGFYEQLRSLFSLDQRGYHRLKIGGVNYIMYQVMVEDHVIKEFRLTDLPIDNPRRIRLRKKIQENFVWARLCGLKCSEGQVVIYEDKVFYLPSVTKQSKIPDVVTKRWFLNESFSELATEMVAPRTILEIRSEIDLIVERNEGIEFAANSFCQELYSFSIE